MKDKKKRFEKLPNDGGEEIDPFSLGSKLNGAVIQNLNRVRLTDSRSATTRGQTLI